MSCPRGGGGAPGAISTSQQAFGDALLRAHPFILMPRMVSIHSRNAIFDPTVAKGSYASVVQGLFAIDTCLHVPVRLGE